MKTMASSPITSQRIEREKVEAVSDFVSLGSKITADIDCGHEIKIHLFLGRNAMTSPDSILKKADILLSLSGRVHWDDSEGWNGEGGWRGVQEGRHMYTHD